MLTLSMLTFFKDYKKYTLYSVFTFWIVSWLWLDLSRWNQLWNNNTCCLSYRANAMLADALATLEEPVHQQAMPGMVLTPKPEYSISSIRIRWVNVIFCVFPVHCESSWIHAMKLWFGYNSEFIFVILPNYIGCHYFIPQLYMFLCINNLLSPTVHCTVNDNMSPLFLNCHLKYFLLDSKRYFTIKGIQLVTIRSDSDLNTLRPRQNGCCFAEDILKCIFLNETLHFV